MAALREGLPDIQQEDFQLLLFQLLPEKYLPIADFTTGQCQFSCVSDLTLPFHELASRPPLL